MREEDELGIISYVFAAMVIWISGAFVAGLAISLNWNWWIVPLIGGRELDIGRGVGIAIFMSMFQSLSETPSIARRDMIVRMLRRNILPPALAIVLGGAWYWMVASR